MHGNMSIRDFEVSPVPYIYEVEPTNACPYKCYMCPRGRGEMKRPAGFMDSGLFEVIIKQVHPEQRMLRLHHFGEPVLHPELTTFIRLTRNAGLIPTLSLNPASLNTRIIDGLIESGAGIVCFSLDSLNSERLHDIRGVTKSADYCQDMIDYFIKRSRYSLWPVFKIIQMVSLSANRDEQSAFLNLKNRYPEDDVYVYISPNFGFGDIELVRETDAEGAEGLLSGNSVCTAPFDDVVVLWNGDVVLCCYDYDGFNIIGNIKDAPLLDIWRDQKVETLRRIFSNGETDRLSFCSKCYLAPHKKPDNRQGRLKRGFSEEQYILSLFPIFRDQT